jgi:enoyl-CoA hydratase/carnithine racemase
LTEEECQEAYEAFQTDDYREGVQAFLERRQPRFEGR